MKQIRIFVFMLLTLIVASNVSAQNGLLLSYTLRDNYEWYTYNLTRPSNQQIVKLKLTEYWEDLKEEYFYIYDSDGLITSISRNSYSPNGNIPNHVSNNKYVYSYGDKELIGMLGSSDFINYFYDSLGRIVKMVWYFSVGASIEGQTMTVNYNDKTSNIIKSMFIEGINMDPDTTLAKSGNMNAEFEYKGDTVTVTLNAPFGIFMVYEFLKNKNQWFWKKISSPRNDDVRIYNEKGLLTYLKSGRIESHYEYNQNGELIKSVNTDLEGKTTVGEYEYEYNSRMDWIKRWRIVDGQRTLSAEREFIYREQ